MNLTALGLVGRTETESETGSTGIESLLERYVDAYWYYGSGKVALRDGLQAMVPADYRPVGAGRAAETDTGYRRPETRPNVLLPAYVPDAVAEPIRELGLEPRYYAVTPDLRPDVTDLERRTDEDTLAVTSINYFGFVQPGLSLVADHADAHECYHIDDNAHSTLSVADGRLLGTFGDVGISSLWKTLPIPNGAVLYVSNDDLRERYEPSSLAGVSDRFDTTDVRFLWVTVVRDVLECVPALQRPVDAIVDRLQGSTVPDPETRYESSKQSFSVLSARACARTDPETLRSRRRRNYRAWLDVLSSVPGVKALFPVLPDGICPQSMPVETDRPGQLQAQLARHGLDDVHTWPRLPAEVATDPAYETAQHLARHVLALPVDRRVDPEHVTSVGGGLADP